MNIKSLFLLIGIVLSGFVSVAQETVRGEVKDAKSGEPVAFATIRVDEKPKAKTDFDGAFSFTTTAGKHIIKVSNQVEGYLDREVEIEVIAGQVFNLVIDLGKDSSVLQIENVIVRHVTTGGVAETVEKSDLQRMEDPAASDGLPKETIRNTGVPTAAEAVQLVPGASVQDGKNVFVRGLGDRYTKTILNGMDIPGLDPDRNSVQMDIFPAVLIDNITVYKTFTPNLTADFTGGLVNIETKDFPDRKTIYFKGGLGYNTNATFNPNYISYDGGAIDFLGFDDGTRRLPISATTDIPHPAENNEATYLATSRFGKTMATREAFSFMNQSYAFTIGNQKNFASKRDSLKKRAYGYNFALNYRNSNTLYEDVQYNEYLRDTDASVTQLFKDRTSNGVLAQNDVMWTALFGQSYKAGRSKLSFTLFHTQNGTSSAAQLNETNYDSNQAVLVKEGLQYTQRSISNANLYGRHFLDSAANWKLTWNVTPTYSRISDPDIRSTALEVADYTGPNGEDIYLWEESVGAEVRRIFRGLNEYNISAKADLNYEFMQWDSLESNLSFGLLNTYKNRSFDVSEYVFRLDGMSNQVPNDPNWFFADSNLWTPEKGYGTYATGQQELANIYEANSMTTAAYVMNELPLSKSFTVTYGARMEKNINRYTGVSNNAQVDPNAPRYENEVVLDKLNVLPSLNMVYKIRKDKGFVTKKGDTLDLKRNTNIRGAYTQTLARPSFREISISQIYDPIQGRRYLGNIDLKQTLIHNADIRWEHFFGRTEIISASAFYKKFINPIEVVANVAAPNEFKPVNAGEADVYGAEFEIRKAIGFNNEANRHQSFMLGANFTYVVSRIDMNKVETIIGSDTLTEREVRIANARDGEEVGQYRQMYGQSPYIINAFATYRNDSLGLMLNVTYNVQGKKLAVIGVGSLPDVYEQPFHSLNLKVSKTLGETKEGESEPRWKASLRGQNLLNFAKRKYYEAYEADSQIFEYLHPGMSFTASITYTIR